MGLGGPIGSGGSMGPGGQTVQGGAMPPLNHLGSGSVPTQSQTLNTAVSTWAAPAWLEQETIWKGNLEWQMKDSQGDQKVTHCITLSAASKKENGTTEVNSNNWPDKLVMQLIPDTMHKEVAVPMLLESSISKKVAFLPEKSENLDILTKLKITQAGRSVGFVQIPGPSDIKILIIAYNQATGSYFGIIPDDQEGFIIKVKTLVKDFQAAFSNQTSQPTNGTSSVQSSITSSTIRPCEYAERVKAMEKYILPLKKKIKDSPVSQAKLNRLLDIISTPNKRLVTRGVLDICEQSLKKVFR